MIKSDIHVHSSYSTDCDTPMEDMIKQAIGCGLTTLCFTEHMDKDYPSDPSKEKNGNPEFYLDTDAYRSGWEKMRDKYSDRIRLLFGVELGLQPQVVDWNKIYVNQHVFDFVIGSFHTIDNMDPYYPFYFEGRSERDSYVHYFEEMKKNIELFSDFDSLGHLDYIVRYGPNKNRDYSYNEYRECLDPVLKLLVEKGIALEVNSAGYRKGLGEPNPCSGVVKRYKELGGELVTIGSDAHNISSLTNGFDLVENLLLECGFTHHAVFAGRKPVFYPLG